MTTSPDLRPNLLYQAMHWPLAGTNAHQNLYMLHFFPKLKECTVLTDWGNLGAEHARNQEVFFTAVFEEVKADWQDSPDVRFLAVLKFRDVHDFLDKPRT